MAAPRTSTAIPAIRRQVKSLIARGPARAGSEALPRRSRQWHNQLEAAVLEFQRPSSAIINAPIPPLAHRITWLTSSMLAVMVGVMAMIPVDQVVTARGIVVA